MKRTFLTFVLALSFSNASAGTYNEAVAAYHKGDLQQAVTAFFDLARQDDPDAQYALATLFEQGDKIEKSLDQAMHWYEQAAIRGNPFAQARYASHLMSGDIIEKNPKLALEFFLAAAKQGHPTSQFNAAYMFENGVGTTVDYASAIEWYEQAAEQGSEKAQYNLGRLLASAPKGNKNPIEAYKWLTLAIEGDNHDVATAAKQIRDDLSRYLTAPQLAAAYEATRQAESERLLVAAPAASLGKDDMTDPMAEHSLSEALNVESPEKFISPEIEESDAVADGLTTEADPQSKGQTSTDQPALEEATSIESKPD